MKLYPRETTLPLITPRKSNSKAPASAFEPLSSRDFEACFEQYWASIYGLLQRMLGDPAEAEDLALETFVRLHQRGPGLNDGSNVGGWLYRVATNLGLHSIRGLRRRQFYELTAGRDALEQSQAESPAEALAEKERQGLVRSALAQMNPRQAQLLLLRYSGMAYKDIASALSLSPASIGPLLLRAEREFEKHYRALAQEEG